MLTGSEQTFSLIHQRYIVIIAISFGIRISIARIASADEYENKSDTLMIMQIEIYEGQLCGIFASD